jgi:IS4 transposase
VMVLGTNRLALDAELLAVAYRYRWAVELFFRWVKCVLGCRHLLSQGLNGFSVHSVSFYSVTRLDRSAGDA